MCKQIALISAISVLVFSPVHAAEDSVYDFLWLDPDKSVYVLQNKVYKKEKTFGLDVSLLTTLTNKFQDTYGLDLKSSYYFNEQWGVELFYTQYSNSDSVDFENVVAVSRSVNTSNVIYPFVRRVSSAMGALAIWSPFYGKVNTFNRIFYFDWSFGLGIASLDTESNINTVAVRNAPNRYDSASYTALAYKTNFKFHISRNKNISLELRNFNYKAPGPINPKKDEVRSNWDVLIGFGVKF